MSRRFPGYLLGVCMLAAAVALPAITAAQGGGTRTSGAAPQPSRIPVSWELNFKHGPLERVFVTLDGKDKTFWFMRYTVVNNSGKDVLFTPNFELVSDTGQVLTAFKEVPAAVFDKIKQLYNNPLLLSPTNVYGKLLQGEDNARDGVAIFPALDSEARDFHLFVMGLSGETAEVKNPISGKPVILQKTLELDYNLPGIAEGITPKVELKSMKWVMK